MSIDWHSHYAALDETYWVEEIAVGGLDEQLARLVLRILVTEHIRDPRGVERRIFTFLVACEMCVPAAKHAESSIRAIQRVSLATDRLHDIREARPHPWKYFYLTGVSDNLRTRYLADTGFDESAYRRDYPLQQYAREMRDAFGFLRGILEPEYAELLEVCVGHASYLFKPGIWEYVQKCFQRCRTKLFRRT